MGLIKIQNILNNTFYSLTLSQNRQVLKHSQYFFMCHHKREENSLSFEGLIIFYELLFKKTFLAMLNRLTFLSWSKCKVKLSKKFYKRTFFQNFNSKCFTFYIFLVEELKLKKNFFKGYFNSEKDKNLINIIYFSRYVIISL